MDLGFRVWGGGTVGPSHEGFGLRDSWFGVSC